MKSIVLVALFASSFAFAQHNYSRVVLMPGESAWVGNTRVSCEGNQEPVYQGSQCTILGSGAYNGWAYNFRLAVGGEVMDGKNNLDDAIASLKKFEDGGICRIYPSQQCKLLGAGAYNGWSYNFRIAIGEEVVDGKNNQADALAIIAKLRTNRICR